MVAPGQGRGHPAYLEAAHYWVEGDHQLKVGVVHPAQKIVLENVPENIHHKVRVFLKVNLFQNPSKPVKLLHISKFDLKVF